MIGIDYYEELPIIKQTDVIKVQYPIQMIYSNSVNRHIMHREVCHPKMLYLEVFCHPTTWSALFKSANLKLIPDPSPEVKKKMHTIHVSDKAIERYGSKPVQTVNSSSVPNPFKAFEICKCVK